MSWPRCASQDRSAFELSEKIGISIAACFRRIKILEDSGLIFCTERRLTLEGKRVSLFRSNIRKAQMVFERKNARAQIEMFDGSTQEVSYDIDMPTLLETTG